MVLRSHFKTNHVSSSSNETAHKLVKCVVSNLSYVIWLEDIPTHVNLFLQVINLSFPFKKIKEKKNPL